MQVRITPQAPLHPKAVYVLIDDPLDNVPPDIWFDLDPAGWHPISTQNGKHQFDDVRLDDEGNAGHGIPRELYATALQYLDGKIDQTTAETKIGNLLQTWHMRTRSGETPEASPA